MGAGRVRVRGALLAGGKSRRMGRDKAGVVVDEGTGATLGDLALAALRAVADDVVILGHGRGLDDALPRLTDAMPEAGPTGGLLALLEAGGAALFVVSAVDMPGVGAPELRLLLDALGASPEAGAAVFAESGEQGFAPLPMALRAEALQAVSTACARGERRLGQVVGALRPTVLQPRTSTTEANINTLEDLERWSGRRRPG